MNNKITVKDVRMLLERNSYLYTKLSDRAEVLRYMMKNPKFVFSRRAKKMMFDKIKDLEKNSKYENFPYSNI